MKENLPVKRHPLFQGKETLDQIDEFSGLFPEEFVNMGELSIEQKSDKFMSDYVDKVNPVGKYKDYFSSSAKTTNHILKEIKNFHKRLVLEGSWSEEKYLDVIDGILTNKIILSVATLDRGGFMYDKKCEPQKNGERTGRNVRLKSSEKTPRKTTINKTKKPRIVSLSKNNNEPPF